VLETDVVDPKASVAALTPASCVKPRLGDLLRKGNRAAARSVTRLGGAKMPRGISYRERLFHGEETRT